MAVGRIRLRGAIDDFFVETKEYSLSRNLRKKEKIIDVSDFARKKMKEWGYDIE